MLAANLSIWNSRVDDTACRREDVVVRSVDDGVDWDCWGCVCGAVLVGGGWWKDWSVERAANWVGEARRVVDMPVWGFCGEKGRGGRSGEVGGRSKVSQVWRSDWRL